MVVRGVQVGLSSSACMGSPTFMSPKTVGTCRNGWVSKLSTGHSCNGQGILINCQSGGKPSCNMHCAVPHACADFVWVLREITRVHKAALSRSSYLNKSQMQYNCLVATDILICQPINGMAEELQSDECLKAMTFQ